MVHTRLVGLFLTGLVVYACAGRPPTLQAPIAPLGGVIVLTEVVEGSPPGPPGPDVRRRGFMRLVPLVGPKLDLSIFVPGQRFLIRLFNDLAVTVQLFHVEQVGDGRLRVMAVRLCKTHGCEPGNVYMTVGEQRLAMMLRLPEVGDVAVERFDDTRLAVSQLALNLPLLCRTPLSPPKLVDFFDNAEPDATSQLDVGILYTWEALCQNVPTEMCGEPERQKLSDELELWVSGANSALSCSAVNARVNLVRLEQIAYTETGNLERDLNVLDDKTTTGGNAILKFRRDHKVDVVMVLVARTDGDNGRANVFRTWFANSFADHATAVLFRPSAVRNHVATHELGHIMGGGHERGHGNGRSWYSHDKILNYGSGVKSTILATGDKYHIELFASPKVYYDGIATGTWHENNVGTFNQTRKQVEDFQNRFITERNPSVPCSSKVFWPTNPS